jgi:hypothetical protein
MTVAHIQALTKIISPHLNTVDKYTSTDVLFLFIIIPHAALAAQIDMKNAVFRVFLTASAVWET